MSDAARLAIGWVEQGLVPDSVVRQGIRRLLARRLEDIGAKDAERSAMQQERVVAEMGLGPTCLVPELANDQHYEVPAGFFSEMLGPRLKYSAALWHSGVTDLSDAEAAALAETCAHAGLRDGQEILELGCGWGSLTLWMAEHYPRAHIVAVSNSASQRAHILERARQAGFANVEVITADMSEFMPTQRFDRIVSVEMFEHMRNWGILFERIHGWLVDGGRFFMHIFAHRSTPYFFTNDGPSDWMSRYFFSGGLMPSDDLPLRFQGRLRLTHKWRWDGRHYERTLNAWLANLDQRRDAVLPILAANYGDADAALWLQRWRIFLMACAELFGYAEGQEWWLSHYLFERPAN